ncbi:MAG TPA: outer membrane beta-barrel protein [Draconibacterium sp.]|nr:outer membrane beta-barrel protein [Draconibacterium sp.]
MKTRQILFLTFFTILFYPALAQRFSVGLESGINFSKINKESNNFSYGSQSGPVNGIIAQYDIGNWFVLQSGLNHATHYFNELNNHYYYSPGYHYSSIADYSSYYYNDQSKYSFLRIPLLIKFKTPGRVNFEIGAGAYYGFVTNDEYRGKDKDFYTKEYIDENFPPMHDWGWILNSSVHYNITEKWNVFASGQITSGHKTYFKDLEGKIGSAEVTFGVAYKPFAVKKYTEKNDSLGMNIKIIPHSGFNISKAKVSKNSGEYASTVGFSSGVSIVFQLGGDLSFSTGAWYERKGYELDYRGNFNLLYRAGTEAEQANAPQLQSRVNLDYITFPLKFHLNFGNKIQSDFNFGPYISMLYNSFAQGEQISTYNYGEGYNVTASYFNESLGQWFKKADGGFMLGYQIDFPVFNWADFSVSINQSFGVVNVLTDKNENPAYSLPVIDEKMHNNSTSFLFGLTIPISKK